MVHGTVSIYSKRCTSTYTSIHRMLYVRGTSTYTNCAGVREYNVIVRGHQAGQRRPSQSIAEARRAMIRRKSSGRYAARPSTSAGRVASAMQARQALPAKNHGLLKKATTGFWIILLCLPCHRSMVRTRVERSMTGRYVYPLHIGHSSGP